MTLSSLALVAVAPIASPADFWTYLTNTLPAGGVVSGVGVGAFVVAILTDRLLTKGSHLRRVADIDTAHDLARCEMARHYDELARAKDEAYRELKESRDAYRTASQVERLRADKVTDSLVEITELVELNVHLLKSLDEAAKDTQR